MCKLLEASGPGNVADARLLELFVRQRDDTAFSVLLHRYGPMVWHVGRRVVVNSHDADDVFQATFLLLARKAESIRKQESIACWLHGVAYRLAVQLRKQRTRRRARERQARMAGVRETGFDAAWRELLAALDEEVALLPDRYRAPLLLCYLDGKTHDEAAVALGCPVGTLHSRLGRARDLLRRRLARRGLTLTATGFAALLASNAVRAAVPAALWNTTLTAAARAAAGDVTAGLVSRQAAILVEGAMKSTLLTKARLGLALLLVAGVTLGGAGALAPAWFKATNAAEAAAESLAPADPKPAAPDRPAQGRDALGDALPPTALARLGTSRLMPGEGDARNLVFSPDGGLLAMPYLDGKVTFWDTRDGRVVHRLPMLPQDVDGHYSFAGVLHDGKTVLFRKGNATFVLVELATGKETRRVTLEAADFVQTFRLSADGKTVAGATLSNKGTALVWDFESGKVKATLTGHTGDIYSVALAPDGKSVFTGSADATARRWNLETGKQLAVFEGHRDMITGVAVAPDGKTAATLSGDGTVRLWDAANGKETKQWESPLRLEATGGFAFADGGKKLVMVGHQSMAVWDTATGKELRQQTANGPRGVGLHMTLSPDGRLLVAPPDNYSYRLKVCDSVTGKEAVEFAGHSAGVLAMAFSPDGKLLATGSADRTVRLWEVPSGKEVRSFRGHTGGVASLAFSPDGKTLASASNDERDKSISLWEVSSGKEVRRIRTPGRAADHMFGQEPARSGIPDRCAGCRPRGGVAAADRAPEPPRHAAQLANRVAVARRMPAISCDNDSLRFATKRGGYLPPARRLATRPPDTTGSRSRRGSGGPRRAKPGAGGSPGRPGRRPPRGRQARYPAAGTA
jgi:RNA polymerase sigma factor (sigma-70 family)